MQIAEFVVSEDIRCDAIAGTTWFFSERIGVGGDRSVQMFSIERKKPVPENKFAGHFDQGGGRGNL